MKVKLISYTQPCQEIKNEGIEEFKDLIAFCARVSNPSNQYNTETSERLINYLIKNKHFSPLEMVNICLEIETTRDIARQILRHRSFSFQEFCVAKGTKINVISNCSKNNPTSPGDNSVYNKSSKFVKINIEDLYTAFEICGNKNQYLSIYDLKINQFGSSKIKEVFKTGEKMCYSVLLQDGKSIQCTDLHKFLKDDKVFYPLRDLRVGDRIGTKRSIKNDIKYKKIVEIKEIGMRETYDISVEHQSHNYVANGIVTHNSQRYADPLKELNFELREARLQDTKNRQNSISVDDEKLQSEWDEKQRDVIEKAKEAYNWAISNGIAKEQARCVLPEGNTVSRLYMNGTLRSWIHYIELRRENGTQKEHSEVAKACAEVISNIYKIY